MKELITIKNENGKQLVSARELYKGLGLSRTKWTPWHNKNIIENEYFLEDESWTKVSLEVTGIKTVDFAISLEFAKHIAMMARTEKSHEYRNYFIECEKKLNEAQQPKLPTTYKEALLELVATIEEKERIEEEKNRLIHVGKNYTTTEMAKELGFRSAVAFNNDLKEKKIQYKVNGTWVLAARYAELGYQSIKQTELENGKIVYSKYWTGLGRDWLLNKIYK